MRYNDWDVLLFPTGRHCKTPFKEFKVACQVIPDVELAHCQGSTGLPIVTCFVPSTQPGAPFRISVHSWSEPDITQFTNSYSKHVEAVQFEARVFIDGRLVTSSTFHRKNKEWPHIIDTTFDLTSSGALALLKFPAFKKELLHENGWDPSHDTGRIKVVISEGFPRDSPTQPFERVKNIVAFSFQHAPLDVLEAAGIAWPNPSMWRAPSLSQPCLVMGYRPDEAPVSHGHSPRRQQMPRNAQAFGQGFQSYPHPSTMGPGNPHANSFLGAMDFPPGPPSIPPNMSGGFPGDSLSDMAYYDWVNSLSAPFANDVTGKPMWPTGPSLGQPGMTNPSNKEMIRTTGFGGDPMHLSGPSLDDDPELVPITNEHTKVPTNTPTTGSTTDRNSCSSASAGPFNLDSNTNSFMTPDFAHSLTHSLLNQPLPLQPQNIPLPASEVKSRKERDTRFLTVHGSNPASAASTPQGPSGHPDIRKFSQPLYNIASNNFNTTIASTSPCSAGLSSVTLSRNISAAGGFDGPSFIGGIGTPLPLRNSSAASLNTTGGIAGAGAGGLGSGSRKRSRNFTPASARAIDDEDQPLRPSPRDRASFGMDGGESG
ncbi:hypothetical protein GE09DRAFT_1229946 [Coniochaeta sp. 2T2.1]|nr:hypothetical protein GE09DRAFT_1229946 [Coniochaeta sp. 2T2.1]